MDLPAGRGLFPRLPPAWKPAFADYQRQLARRMVVVAAWLGLVLMPALELLERTAGYAPVGAPVSHPVLRLLIMAVAATILALRYWRPEGRWPRPAAVGFALLTVSVGWGMLLQHAITGSPGIYHVTHSLTLFTAMVAALATRGARDLALVYLVPLVGTALVLLQFRSALPTGLQHAAYPTAAMLTGVVLAEMLYRVHLQAFATARALEDVAMTDPLTGLLNRRSMDALLAAEGPRARRRGQSFAVIMADLDHFKYVNDSHGHEVGDEVLRELALRLRATVRAEDQVARWGGEEFLVLLSDTSLETAFAVAEKIRTRIAETPFFTSVGALEVTISLGVAIGDGSARSPRDSVSRADAALYRAKQAGRNRTASAP